MLPRVAEEKLAEYCDVFCEPNVFPVEQARTVLQAAQALGLGLRVHADQFSADYGSLLAAELHAATADHLESTTPAALAALRTAGVQPVLLPASVYSLGSTRYPAARRMIDLGLPVVLATDFNPGSSPTASMPMVLSLAATQMKMTAAEVDHGGHHQCRVQPRPGQTGSARSNPAKRPISSSTIATTIGNSPTSSAASRRWRVSGSCVANKRLARPLYW